MGSNFSIGDQVIALVDLGSGVKRGTHGTVTSVSVFHGHATVRFTNGAQVSAIKLHQIAHA